MPDRGKRILSWDARLLVVALAIVIAVVAVVASRSGNYGASGHSAPNHRPVLGPVIPADMQAVAYHGVQIYVPANWKINNERCGTPQGNTVVLADGGLIASCLTSGPTRITVVSMERLDTVEGRRAARAAIHVLDLGGTQVRTGTMPAPHPSLHAAVYVLSAAGVVLTVAAPSQAQIDSIVHTVRIVSVDSNGCAQFAVSLAPGPQAYAAADRFALVPGAPTAATICRYSGGWLVRSVALTHGRLLHLQRALNALPPGATHVANFRHEPVECGTDSRHGFLVHFRYPRGFDLQVAAHIGDCPTLTAYNGVRLTGMDEDVVGLLIGFAGYDGELPEPGSLSQPRPAPSAG